MTRRGIAWGSSLGGAALLLLVGGGCNSKGEVTKEPVGDSSAASGDPSKAQPISAADKEAEAKRLRAESLCADSERFLATLRQAEREMTSAVAEARATGFKPVPTLQLIENAKKRAQALTKAAAEAKDHGRKSNEVNIQKAFVWALEGLAKASQIFHDAAKAALDGQNVEAFNEAILGFEGAMREFSPTLRQHYDTIDRECRLTRDLAASGTAQASSAGAAAVAPAAAPPYDGPIGPEITAKVVESINASTAYPANRPEMAIDGKPLTSWSGAGGRPWLELGLVPGTRVDAVELSGGRTDKYFSLDRWTGNGVIAAAEIIWDSGKGTVSFDRATDRGVRKKVPVGAITRTIRIQVLDVAAGTQHSDADIDELKLFGSVTEPSTPPAAGFAGRCQAGKAALDFRNGRLVGGAWRLADDKVFEFLPGQWRTDDGEWHSISVKYEREKLRDDLWGFEAAGTIVRYKLNGQQLDVTVNGAPEAGSCTPQ